MTKICYNGLDNKRNPTFNRAENVNILGVEVGENPKMLTDSWNKYTNIWLKRTVYTRAPKAGRMPLTYFTSAFWHGFYRTISFIVAGYYLTFMSASLITMTGRAVRRCIHPLFNNHKSRLSGLKKVYDVVGSFCSITIMNYFFIPFMTRDFWPSVTIWIDTWFFGHVVALICIVSLEYLGFGKTLKAIFIPKETKKE